LAVDSQRGRAHHATDSEPELKGHTMKGVIITLAAAFALLMRLAANETQPNSDTQLQEGVWKPIAAVMGGAKLPKLALDTITLKVSGANYEVIVRGEKEADRGTRALDETTKPKRITLKSTNGPNRGKTFLGIYEMTDANSMRVCYDLSGTVFPPKFESTAETGYYLVDYRRSAPEAPPKATNAAEDAKRQNGIWNPAGALLGGVRLTKEEMKKITLTIKDGTYTVVVEGEPQPDTGTVTLDTSVIPKRMTIQGGEGPNKGKTILAVYEMGQRDGIDTFRVCYDLSGKAFPTDFTSPKGSMHYLVGYRRKSDAASVPRKDGQ
jgi:uncharacterized protein (TIGR03067 family)